ncbi:MAG: hypothetical protein IID16_01030 [Candidatus Marinimicrobia bacterium]|nr:hypothetical protein [Candidatus Neomarinimicrobiota bacterium]
MEIIVKIKWDEPKEKDWLCAGNVSLALHAYCKTTKFKVSELREIKESDPFINSKA